MLRGEPGLSAGSVGERSVGVARSPHAAPVFKFSTGAGGASRRSHTELELRGVPFCCASLVRFVRASCDGSLLRRQSPLKAIGDASLPLNAMAGNPSGALGPSWPNPQVFQMRCGCCGLRTAARYGGETGASTAGALAMQFKDALLAGSLLAALSAPPRRCHRREEIVETLIDSSAICLFSADLQIRALSPQLIEN
jgi:hypothetical protein